MTPNKLTTGEKIKYYRKQRKISQFDIEMNIQASPGMLSRIEQDKVSPTKETLLKIAEVLDLTNIETASLFGIVIEVSQFEDTI